MTRKSQDKQVSKKKTKKQHHKYAFTFGADELVVLLPFNTDFSVI